MESDKTDSLHHKLGITARKIVENNKGILAIDESPSSMKKKLSKLGIENTYDVRRKFRELMITTSDISDKLGGIILHEETFEQKADDGTYFVDLLIKKGISPGIKLDKGLIDFKNNEDVSVGIEDLEKRLKKDIYRKADFAKWRSVFKITDTTPTEECIVENCKVLAYYAKTCQKYKLVPIVEPEILWNGFYDINEASRIAKIIFSCIIYYLNLENVYIQGVIMKIGFVTEGMECEDKVDMKVSAHKTFEVLLSTIPCGIPALVFLSGGHQPEKAIEFLDKMNKEKGKKTWALSFSYGRAITNPVLSAWNGKKDNTEKAQKVFMEQIVKCFKAVNGQL